MKCKVGWTQEAETTFKENIDYLAKYWDITTIHTFLDRVDEIVETLEVHPELFPVHRKKDNVHKCVINKHILLYYRIISKSRIDLLSFWNTHQDPESLNV